MWLLLAGLALLTGDVLSQGFVRFQGAPLRPISPVSGFSSFHSRPIVHAPLRNSNIQPIRGSSFNPTFARPTIIRNTVAGAPGIPLSSNPCNPSPCGDYTTCSVSNSGIAMCRCIENYVPIGNTIQGCEPQCVSDDGCPDDYKCRSQQCERVCRSGACGTYAECRASNHRAICSCPSGFGGDPNVACSRLVAEVRVPPPLAVDLCHPNPCGSNADCRVRGDRPVCTCPLGYEGDPLSNCIKGECIEHRDCPSHRACQNLRCIDPCVGACGTGAECVTRNNQPVCSCPRQHIGDPFVSCRRLTAHDICNPTPCGQNTECSVRNDNNGDMRAVCTCIRNYIGNALTGCRPECVSDNECLANQQCMNNICRNPCVDGCGDGAYCDVINHRAVCRCPEYFLGDAHSRCYAECTEHDDCPNHQACSNYRCINPCDGVCGTNADCKVENHTPICSCPRDHTGDPFVSCRPFTLEDLCRDNPCGSNGVCTPGKDRSGNDRPVCTCPTGYVGNPLISCLPGQCTDHNDCPNHQACYAYMCQSPCVTEVGSVCGTNADCQVKNHQPVCSCPGGYIGNPLESCRVSPSARVAGHLRSKRR